MIKKLKSALKKVVNRLSAREEDRHQAEDKSHRLTREIKELRSLLDEAVKRHSKTLAELHEEESKDRPNKERIDWLRKLEGDQTQNVNSLKGKIEFKVGKRSSWRKRARKERKRVAWWLKRRTILRKQFKEAKEKWEKEHRLDFQEWMLNGCPNINNANLKEVMAFVVVACDQYVTATTNGTHAPGSFHYIEEAFDWGSGSVSSMQSAAVKVREKFGRSHFLEFFSPCGWWIKYGIQYAGHFPGHGDHGHCGVDK